MIISVNVPILLKCWYNINLSYIKRQKYINFANCFMHPIILIIWQFLGTSEI